MYVISNIKNNVYNSCYCTFAALKIQTSKRNNYSVHIVKI
jgi:hypothetical protein